MISKPARRFKELLLLQNYQSERKRRERRERMNFFLLFNKQLIVGSKSTLSLTLLLPNDA
jgi:hypothetical protein